MDRRRKSKPLHANLSDLIKASSQTSLRRIGSTTSLSSEASSVVSKKRKNYDEDSGDENLEGNRKKKSHNENENETSVGKNVRNTRGAFLAGNENDDSLMSQFQQNNEENVKESRKRKHDGKQVFFHYLFVQSKTKFKKRILRKRKVW